MNYLDILIPTYNRAEILKKNLERIEKQIVECGAVEKVGVNVSDNCSTDDTENVLLELSRRISIKFEYTRQSENIDIEPNTVFLLASSEAKYVMYLGDDDFLPDGYIEFILNEIEREKGLNCIFPGFSGLYQDGTVKPARFANFDLRKIWPNFLENCYLSNFGHQLSGIVFRREGLLDSYTEFPGKRNMYPWIYFALHCNGSDGYCYYAPKFQVLVSQSNVKYWSYDESGLLTEIYKNYALAFRKSLIKQSIACIITTKVQSWRLRISRNPKDGISAFNHLLRSNDVLIPVKLTLPAIYMYGYAELLCRFAYRKLRGQVS